MDKFGIPRTFESSRIHAAALVVGEYSEEYSHWEASRSLGEWLREEGVPGITGILYRHINIDYGEMGGMRFLTHLQISCYM